MTYYIRTKDGKTLIDIECWVKTEDDNSFVEISTSVEIMNYSIHLLSIKDMKQQMQCIRTFDELSELRGWLWEVYFMTKENTKDEYDNVRVKLREILNNAAKLSDLVVVED